MSAKDIMQVVSVLPNYREIHRLVRLYVLELDFFQQQGIKVTDYNPTDLLWLTIVMLYDYNTYVKLHDDPEQYVIYKRWQSNSNVWLLSLRSGINPDDRQDPDNKDSYKGNKLRKSTAKALVNLFQKANPDTNSMCLAVNFDHYFYLGVHKNQLTRNEFQQVIESSEKDVEDKVREWKTYDLSSVYNIIATFYPRGRSIEELKNFYKIIISYALMKKEDKFTLILSECFLLSSSFTIQRSYIKPLREYILNLCKNSVIRMSDSGEFEYMAKLLQHLYPLINDAEQVPFYYEGDEEVYGVLLTTDNVRELYSEILSAFLNQEEDKVDACDIINKNTALGKIYSHTSVQTNESEDWRELNYKNLTIDYIVAYFENHKSDQLELFERIKSEINLSMDHIEQDQWLDKNFSNKKSYDDFVNKCFIHKKVLCQQI